MHRDDIIEYAFDEQHSEEHGIKQRKLIYKVTGIIVALTIAQIVLSLAAYNLKIEDSIVWAIARFGFIGVALIKAFYVVFSLMHLGDERKNFRNFVVIPYVMFMLYLLIITLTEGNHQLNLSGLIN
ncbi:MAG: hypothetical protein ACXITV_08845 [Luteibaculaceae bacterium]